MAVSSYFFAILFDYMTKKIHSFLIDNKNKTKYEKNTIFYDDIMVLKKLININYYYYLYDT